MIYLKGARYDKKAVIILTVSFPVFSCATATQTSSGQTSQQQNAPSDYDVTPICQVLQLLAVYYGYNGGIPESYDVMTEFFNADRDRVHADFQMVNEMAFDPMDTEVLRSDFETIEFIIKDSNTMLIHLLCINPEEIIELDIDLDFNRKIYFTVRLKTPSQLSAGGFFMNFPHRSA
jgi:hypothetical protein